MPKIDELDQLKVEYQKIIEEHNSLTYDQQSKEIEFKSQINDKEEKIKGLLKELEEYKAKIQIFGEIQTDKIEAVNNSTRTIVKSNIRNITAQK